jgi:hypothetical protein
LEDCTNPGLLVELHIELGFRSASKRQPKQARKRIIAAVTARSSLVAQPWRNFDLCPLVFDAYEGIIVQALLTLLSGK